MYSTVTLISFSKVKSIELLQGAMKKLVMGAINMKLPKDARENIIRTCVLSIRMLEVRMRIRGFELSRLKHTRL